MLKIYRVPQNLRDSATFPGGVQLCKKIPARCDFIVEIADNATQKSEVLRLLNIAYGKYCEPCSILIRFFRDDSTNTVNSATLSYLLNGACRYSAVCDIVKVHELNAYIQQEVSKNTNIDVKGI